MKRDGAGIFVRRQVESLLALLLAVALVFPPMAGADPKDKKDKKRPAASLKGLPITELSEVEAILHALNRLGYGPRPGDLDRVRQMGLEKWVDQQLRPDAISDSALEVRLERYATLAMSAEQLLNEYPRPQQAAQRAGISREEYAKMREEIQKQREERRRMAEGEVPASDATAMPAENAPRGRLGQHPVPDPSDPRLRLLSEKSPQRIIAELSMAKVTRAVHSERQLQEVMTDFWFNHFNVFAGKGADRWLLTAYERDVIRPHTLGKFHDLLAATAKSPAMLFYLDNWQSVDPDAFARLESDVMQRRQRFQGLFGGFGQTARRMPGAQGNPQQQQRMRRGLNENYARELMELHTLGVDGGYTQEDVIQVAKAFTGWSLRAPRRDPEFHFEERFHSSGPFTVMGKKIDRGGMKDGEEILEMLSRHPSTAKFISTKLARYFVSDAPPQALVDRMAEIFLETGGNIRSVLDTMFHSPEFWSRAAYRAKIKKPFELVASTARALDAQADVPLGLVMWTSRIGEPLYLCQPPTGYSDKAEAWVNTGALLNRLNFALSLADGRLRGVRVDVPRVLEIPEGADARVQLDRAIAVLLAGQASPQTRATLEKQVADPKLIQASLDDPISAVNAGVVAGLVLGAPEFQRR